MQPLVFEPATGTYKFTAFNYTQVRSGVPVFRSKLTMLVRNEPGFPLVLASADLRDLGPFQVNPAGPIAIDDQGIAAAVQARYGAESEVTGTRLVIFAGVDEQEAAPRLANETYVVDGVDEWLLVTDAQTGELLYEEYLICFGGGEIAGNIDGRATEGIGAEQCEEEPVLPLPYSGGDQRRTGHLHRCQRRIPLSHYLAEQFGRGGSDAPRPLVRRLQPERRGHHGVDDARPAGHGGDDLQRLQLRRGDPGPGERVRARQRRARLHAPVQPRLPDAQQRRLPRHCQQRRRPVPRQRLVQPGRTVDQLLPVRRRESKHRLVFRHLPRVRTPSRRCRRQRPGGVRRRHGGRDVRAAAGRFPSRPGLLRRLQRVPSQRRQRLPVSAVGLLDLRQRGARVRQHHLGLRLERAERAGRYEPGNLPRHSLVAGHQLDLPAQRLQHRSLDHDRLPDAG